MEVEKERYSKKKGHDFTKKLLYDLFGTHERNDIRHDKE